MLYTLFFMNHAVPKSSWNIGIAKLLLKETLRRLFGGHLHVTFGAYRKSFGS